MKIYKLVQPFLFPTPLVNKNKLIKAIQGKTVLITGASSGIGKQLAISLAALNIKLSLILIARREDKLVALQQSLQTQNITIHIIRADLRDHNDLERVLNFIHEQPNGLDIFISNAGLSINRSIHHSLDRYHDFTRTMAINYFAPVQLLLSIIPILEKRNGHIINISTINALTTPLPKWAAYQASKTAFDTWLQSTAPEIKHIGITATSIYLPLVRTPMITPTKAYDNAPAMTVETAAKIITRTMYTKQRRYKPWWLIFGELASVLFKKPVDRIFYHMGKRRK